MSENNAAAGSLAITEKRPQRRHGGCVGIFFQLFEWNRRFAKKNLFSKKFLPPARAKHASNKFGGTEKMPKVKPHLIADENSGGFPNVNKNVNRSGDIIELKHEMRPPGLVARLMGLESLPAVNRDKHKKSLNSITSNVKEEKFGNGYGEIEREDMNLEKRGIKVESRPQKLQKIGKLDRWAVTRFGTEALQIKGVLSRSRKHHRPKLTSPVKSPRLSNSSKNALRASRLIDAAARILEPGLQATSRAKCALTYSSSIDYATKDQVLAEGKGFTLPDKVKQEGNHASYNVGVGQSLMGQNACKNCGNLLDVVDSRLDAEQEIVCLSSAPNSVYASSQQPEMIKPRPPIFASEHEDVICQRYPDKLFFATERPDKNPARTETVGDKKFPAQEGQVKQPLQDQQCRSWKDESSSRSFKPKTLTQNEFSIGRNRTSPSSKSSNLQGKRATSAANAISGTTKDFVALNRKSSSRIQPRMSNRAYNSQVDTERKFCSRRDNSVSHLRNPVRKRRTSSVNPQAETSANADHTCIKEGSTNVAVRNRANGNKGNGVISFASSSPLKPENSSRQGLKEKRDQIDMNISQQKQLLLDKNDGKAALKKPLPLTEDALGAILEQKLKELTSHKDEELSTSMKTTAMILQELILALTSEQHISPVGHIFDAVTPLQSVGKRRENDADHLSPGSVLDASFSNDSCVSSSVDDGIGRRLLLDTVYYSHIEPQKSEREADLQDSASSMNGDRGSSVTVTDLLDHISRILPSIDLAGGALTGCELTYTKEVILMAELLFGSKRPCNSERTNAFLIIPSLLSQLEAHAGAMQTYLGRILGFDGSKQGNQLKGFLFDCVIECLDAKYSRYTNFGFETWRKAPFHTSADMLIPEVEEEVMRWGRLSGMIPDEIIEWEMSHSLGKWIDFEIEAFETGAKIGKDILQVLVEEVVTDLQDCLVVL